MSDRWRIDSHKLVFHPGRVHAWEQGKDDWDKAKLVYPLYWEITTHAACNHRCTFCSVDAIGYPNIAIDAELLIQRMNEAAGLGVKSVMLAGTGEPLLHKSINTIVGGAKGAGLDIGITTNGIALHRFENLPLCTWVKISLNAGTKDSYAAIHQTDAKDWERVWNNIHDAVKRKGNCTLGVQCVVLPENLRDMRHLARLSMDAGVDYLVLKPYTQATFMLGTKYKDLNYKPMDEELRTVEELSNGNFKVIYRQDSFRQEAEDHKYPVCNATPFFWTYTMANGDMFACSAHLLDKRFCIGNINSHSFEEIWTGDKRRALYEEMKTFDIAQCRLNCRMDKVNRYLHDLTAAEHVNFI